MRACRGMSLSRCAGCLHRCLQEAAGQSQSGAQPVWLTKVERSAERGSQVLAVVQEVQLEHRLTEAFKEHGVVHEQTKHLIREIGSKLRRSVESDEDWQHAFIETIEGALPGWDRTMAQAAIAVALGRPKDSLGHIIWAETADSDDGGETAVPCAVAACWAGCRSVVRAMRAVSSGVSTLCDAMARQCVQTPSGELTALGDSWLKDRAYGGAAEAYLAAADAVRRPPYIADLHHRRALALLGLGRPHEGLDELRTALRLNPTHPPALYCFGSLVYSLRTGGEPMGHEAALDRRTRGAAARAARRARHQPLPTLKEAEQALRLAITMSEDAKTRTEVRLSGTALAAAYNNHAVVLASLGGSMSQQAATQLSKALAGGGGSDVSLANVGLLLLSGRTADADLPAAITRLRQLVQRRPQLPQAHHALAAALHRQGLTFSEMADSPVCFGEADAPRRLALAKRQELVAEAAAHYRTALALQRGRGRTTYASSLDRALRAGRGVNGVRWVRPAEADISDVRVHGYTRPEPEPELSEPEPEPAAVTHPEPAVDSGPQLSLELERETHVEPEQKVESEQVLELGLGPNVEPETTIATAATAGETVNAQDTEDNRPWEFVHTAHTFESFRSEALQAGIDGSMAVASQFHGEGITDIDSSIAGSVLHAADVSTSFWVWSRDSVQPASRAVVHAGLASSLLQLGQRENAMAQWREALRLFPEFVTARYNLACALLDAHHTRQREEQRLRKQQQEEQLVPNAAANGNVDMKTSGLDMESEAVHHLGVVLSLAPDHPKANNTVANWLALRGDRAGAAEHYARAGEHSDMGLSSLPAIGPVAHGYPHSAEKRLSSALIARFAENSVGHWSQPVQNTSSSPKSRFLCNDNIVADRYASQLALPSTSESSALSTVAADTNATIGARAADMIMGALPLMPSNSMIEPHSSALVATNPVPALVESRQPFGICRPPSATPPSATWAERSTAMTTSTSSPLKKPLEQRQLLVLTGHADTGRRAEPPPTTVTYRGGMNWHAQRMRDSRGTVDAQEEEDRGERKSMLATIGPRGSPEPSPAVLSPLPGAVSSPSSVADAAERGGDTVPTVPKHLAGSEPDAIAAELSERLQRRAAPARGGDGIEDVWRGWMPVPSLPEGGTAAFAKAMTPTLT